MFWIQLTRTNAVFSRIALVSRFCAENQLSEKSVENMENALFHQRNHGARRRDGGGPRGPDTTWWRGWAWPAPPHGVVASAPPPTPLRNYIVPFDLITTGESTIIQKRLQNAAATENPISGPETPFWHPAGMGNWRRSSPSSPPTLLPRPSMFPPSMCE